MMSNSFLAFVSLVLIANADTAVASERDSFDMRNWTASADVETKRWLLYRRHVQCSDAASERMLSVDEAAVCVDTYLMLKLTFLPGADAVRFRTLSPATRALAHQKAYAAYRAWRHRQLSFLETDGTSSIGPAHQ